MIKSVLIYGGTYSGIRRFMNDLKDSLSGTVVIENIDGIKDFNAMVKADNIIIEGCSTSMIADVIELNSNIRSTSPINNNIFFLVLGADFETCREIFEDFYTLQSIYL